MQTAVIKDLDIRKRLLASTLKHHRRATDTRVIEELGLCQGDARIDIAVLNGHLTGYEIKSEADTLTRLSAQRNIYNKILDYVVLVSYTKHLTNIDDHIPAWWGIIEVVKEKKSFTLRNIRDARRNPSQDHYSLAQLLWKDEVVAILRDKLNIYKGLKSKNRQTLWAILATSFALEELSKIVLETLKQRRDWRVDQ